MAHPVSARLNDAYTASAGRKFGLTIGAALGVIGTISRWRGHPTVFTVLITVAALLIVAASTAPTKLRRVEEGWMKFAHALSRVTTPVFMSVVYFVVVTPVGFLRRRLGGNALVHRAGPQGLWYDRTNSPPSALERLF